MTLLAAPADFLEHCRQALAAEQARSLAETHNWSHVDKPRTHADWDVLYRDIAPLIDQSTPASPAVQQLMARHYDIVSRFYPPSQLAYIGMALFYRENADMKAFHDGYHPQMVAFIGEAIWVWAQQNLPAAAEA